MTVLAGRGNNGGGGWPRPGTWPTAASTSRWSWPVPHRDPAPRPPPARRPAGDGRADSATPRPAALVIDALVGYGLTGPLAGATGELAAWADDTAAPVLALDAPTGLDVTTGTACSGAIAATATVTLALPKPGLLGAPEIGELYLADISVPAAVYRRLGIEVPPCSRRPRSSACWRPGRRTLPGCLTGPA